MTMGKPIKVNVTIDAAGVHAFPPTAVVPFKAANAEIIWTITTRGWRFTESGIQIDQGDGTARLAWLLQRRDEHWINLLKMGTKALGTYERETQRDYQRFVSRGGRQFHSPHNGGREFRWRDYNDYAELYQYSIEVTNGSTTMWLDPAIKNQGC